MVAEKRPCRIKVIVKGPSGHGALPMHGGAAAKSANMITQGLINTICLCM